MTQLSLLNPPVLHKFFSNKVRSTDPFWRAYLLEVADVFRQFDGQPYDKSFLEAQFAHLASHNTYTLRDRSKFRDEFSAYASYLGIFYLENDGAGGFTCRLTGAARQLLCSAEPDVEAFCRVQLALFQYPLGHGLAYQQNRVWPQANVRDDTVRQVRAGLRVVPLRMCLRALLAQVEQRGAAPEDAYITYEELLALFNTPATCTTPSPVEANILQVIDRWRGRALPVDPNALTQFRHNFHILEQTGLLRRQGNRLCLNLGSTQEDREQRLTMSRAVAGMTTFFSGFDECTGGSLESCATAVIMSGDWQRYFDAANLPAATLAVLAPGTPFAPELAQPTTAAAAPPPIPFPLFPELGDTQPGTPPQPPLPLGLASPADPEATRILREKANRHHARIVSLLDAKAREAGLAPKDNTFVDLYVKLEDRHYIIEAKSCHLGNLLPQVRRAVSQLYEYRYRAKLPGARLWLVLEERPVGAQAWIEDYLVADRQICLGWLEGDVTIRCHPTCGDELSFACS